MRALTLHSAAGGWACAQPPHLCSHGAPTPVRPEARTVPPNVGPVRGVRILARLPRTAPKSAANLPAILRSQPKAAERLSIHRKRSAARAGSSAFPPPCAPASLRGPSQPSTTRHSCAPRPIPPGSPTPRQRPHRPHTVRPILLAPSPPPQPPPSPEPAGAAGRRAEPLDALALAPPDRPRDGSYAERTAD